MKYDKRHFSKLEDLRAQVAWTKEELGFCTDKSEAKDLKKELNVYAKDLKKYKEDRPGIQKAYNKFIREGKSTLD